MFDSCMSSCSFITRACASGVSLLVAAHHTTEHPSVQYSNLFVLLAMSGRVTHTVQTNEQTNVQTKK
jgi:hypothetical protein